MCAIVPRYLERVIQRDCYSSCVNIHCQETDSGDCNRLKTLVGVTVNCKAWILAIALSLSVVMSCQQINYPIHIPSNSHP
jgi:hypothetical protein